MLRARPFQVLLLLAIGVAAVNAKEPGVVYGPGTVTCKVYLNLVREPMRRHQADLMLAWVQGFFSARNYGHGDHLLTVGGSISPNTLEAMLTDQCSEEKGSMLLLSVVVELYDKLEDKGL